MKAGSIEIRIDYDENRHIIGFNVTDTQDTTLKVKVENKGTSVPNKGNQKKEKDGNLQKLLFFYNKTLSDHPEQKDVLTEFCSYWKKRLETWKGDFRVEELWQNRLKKLNV